MSKIMIVDDEPDILKIIEPQLTRNGYDVIQASSGREALAKVESDQPDLIVLDLSMADVNGWQVAHRLKKDTRYNRIPIILLSALIADGGPGEPLDQCDFMMSKPFKLENLLNKIKELVNKKIS
jgi:CheY-like chemotaxis protein